MTYAYPLDLLALGADKNFGIDVSEFQDPIDYRKVAHKSGAAFAMIRAGYGRDISQKDACFEKHYAGFRSFSIPLGTYQYSYSNSVSRTEEEAKAMISWLKGKEFPLGVFYDMEEGKIFELGTETICEMARTWCRILSEAGYIAGVYASSYWFETVLKPIVGMDIPIWCADWGKEAPDFCNIWQFGGETNLLRPKNVPGVPGTCDQNFYIPATPVIDPKPIINGGMVQVLIREIYYGMTGEDVKSMQSLLNMRGYSCGEVDGIYGVKTKAAVLAFQKAFNLAEDSICGKNTWTKLLNG